MKKSIILLALLSSFAMAEGKLALLIDTSGSMKGKESEIKKVASMVLEKQKEADVYFFSNYVKKVTQNDIDHLRVGGGTKLSLALKELAKRRDVPKAVIVVTDGVPESEEQTLKSAEALKKKKSVICSAYVGSGNKPKILDTISDVSIISSSLKASLDSCLNNAKLKEVIPFSFEEDLSKHTMHFLPQSTLGQERDTTKSTENMSIAFDNKKALIVLVDASGENYSCDSIRESNFRKIKSILSKDKLKNAKVSDIYFGLFSRDTDIIGHVSIDKYKGRTDKAKYRKLVKNAQLGVNSIAKKMGDYYQGILKSGEKVFYGKDIDGALKSSLKLIKEKEKNRAKHYREVEIVFFSDMVQSVDKKMTMQSLLKEPIKLPENTHVTVYGKALTCAEEQSEKQKLSFVNEVQSFWNRVIVSDNGESVKYFTNY